MVYDPTAIDKLLRRKGAVLPKAEEPRQRWEGPIKEVPCAVCGKTRFVFRRDFDYDEPDLSLPCHRCDVPDNPTRGWLISEYRRRGLPELELARRGDGIDKFLRDILGIEVVSSVKADRAEEEAKKSAR